MVLEKLYPKQVNFNALPQNKFLVSRGSATYQPLTMTNSTTAGSYVMCSIQTTEYYDLSAYSTLTMAWNWGVYNTGHMRVYLFDRQGHQTDIGGSIDGGSANKTIDLSNYNTEYKIAIDFYYEYSQTLTFSTLLLS